MQVKMKFYSAEFCKISSKTSRVSLTYEYEVLYENYLIATNDLD